MMQDPAAAKNLATGKGVWISSQLWRAVSRQLQSQVCGHVVRVCICVNLCVFLQQPISIHDLI